MQRIRRHLTYANVMSTLAVAFAIAGGSTAIAVSVNASKKSDINPKGNIRAGKVSTKKLANNAVASSKLGQIEIVQATAVNEAMASCPPSARLLSGGGAVAGGIGAAVARSLPKDNGWQATINSGVGAQEITAYALCLR
jgi:hypothetical protein